MFDLGMLGAFVPPEVMEKIEAVTKQGINLAIETDARLKRIEAMVQDLHNARFAAQLPNETSGANNG